MPAIRPPDFRAALTALAIGLLLVHPPVTAAFPAQHRYGHRQPHVDSFNTTLPGLGLRGLVHQLDAKVASVDSQLDNTTDLVNQGLTAMHRRLLSLQEAVRDLETAMSGVIAQALGPSNATRHARGLLAAEDNATTVDEIVLNTTLPGA